MAKAGRPAKDFDRELFEQLCAIMCTEEEICSIFNTTDKTLVNWCQRTYGMNFSEAQKKYSARGKMSLRRYQFKLAQKSAAMAIFLGKNYLGQKDNIIETDEQTLQAVGEALVKIKRAAEQADNNE